MADQISIAEFAQDKFTWAVQDALFRVARSISDQMAVALTNNQTEHNAMQQQLTEFNNRMQRMEKQVDVGAGTATVVPAAGTLTATAPVAATAAAAAAATSLHPDAVTTPVSICSIPSGGAGTTSVVHKEGISAAAVPAAATAAAAAAGTNIATGTVTTTTAAAAVSPISTDVESDDTVQEELSE